mmetsp:Transcript_44007/g.145794  ORF Transcript_44007/g.145794 Transcript_44007/m.145794 type:complete len:611 (+) Transcript_44007:428-2260(+)
MMDTGYRIFRLHHYPLAQQRAVALGASSRLRAGGAPWSSRSTTDTSAHAGARRQVHVARLCPIARLPARPSLSRLAAPQGRPGGLARPRRVDALIDGQPGAIRVRHRLLSSQVDKEAGVDRASRTLHRVVHRAPPRARLARQAHVPRRLQLRGHTLRVGAARAGGARVALAAQPLDERVLARLLLEPVGVPREPVQPAAAVERLHHLPALAPGRLLGRPARDGTHRLVPCVEQPDAGRVRARRRLRQRVGRRDLVEVALVEGPLADVPRLAGRAVEHVLKLVRVVEDVEAPCGKLGQLGLGRECARLDLELFDEPVDDALRGGGDRVAPHLLHPALDHPLRLGVGAEPQREVEPLLVDAAQLVEVDEERRRADGLHALVRPSGPVLLDHPLLRRLRKHVPKHKGRRLLRSGEVRDGAHDDVVRLEDEHIVTRLSDLCEEGRALHQLLDRVWPVEDAKVEVRRQHLRAQLHREERRDLAFEPVGPPAGRRAQPREGRHVGALAAGRGGLLPVVVHDARLPLLIDRPRRRQHGVVGTPPRAAVVGSGAGGGGGGGGGGGFGGGDSTTLLVTASIAASLLVAYKSDHLDWGLVAVGLQLGLAGVSLLLTSTLP